MCKSTKNPRADTRLLSSLKSITPSYAVHSTVLGCARFQRLYAKRRPPIALSWSSWGGLGGSLGLGGAGHDLNLVGSNAVLAVVHLERYVLQLKGPDLVAESVGIETALWNEGTSALATPAHRHRNERTGDGPGARAGAHLERQARADLLLQDLGDSAVEVGEDLHGQLGIDAVVLDQVIEGVGQSCAYATRCAPWISKVSLELQQPCSKQTRRLYLLRRYSS